MELVQALRKRGIDYRMRVSNGTHNWEYVAPAMAEALRQADKTFNKE